MSDVISTLHEPWMRQCLELAGKAAVRGEVPVGALVVDADNRLLASGFNRNISGVDCTAHAEIVALREACRLQQNYRLPGCTLYVTIEPCTMCLGALIHARVRRVVFGALEPKAGVLISNPDAILAGYFNHTLEVVGGVCEDACSALIQTFFKQRRERQKKLKKSARERLSLSPSDDSEED